MLVSQVVSQTLNHIPTEASENMVGEIQDFGTCEPLFAAFKRRH